ncbi:GlsB/YeaQ/YmgE family stress response membrane protein [Ruegeria sediminis]|uniref:GlsB/YeaQ/YmgE family stress response membrane protein n=1 Tax=Ruegeria sediminis TaxID=2583820 RepID=A0ABY2WVI9_9RHOB|nr:GlsB/YeaQ/YmgE family stress response membrane protein [Ruegeria sediminis]TMV06777.1 GlsB/YeaQ/YmgE family stress response membrane protein [Ruegeria sediminis]
MQFGSLLSMLIIGAIAGWLSGKIMVGRGFGLIGNIIVGIVGAFLAGLMFPVLGFSAGGGVFATILHATIGAVILLFLISLIRKVN